jgi:hypothetical protein
MKNSGTSGKLAGIVAQGPAQQGGADEITIIPADCARRARSTPPRAMFREGYGQGPNSLS